MAAIRRAMPVEQRIEIDGITCFCGRRAGRGYWLVSTGIGPEAAHAAAVAVLNHGAALAISTGFTGALLPESAVGETMLATSIVPGTFDGAWRETGPPIACDDAVIRAVHAAAAEVGATARSGPMVSVSTVLCRAAEKQQIGRSTGAIAIDMESAAIGTAARAYGVPFAVIRTVSDTADEDLPLDFNLFLKPWGWARGAAALLLAPSSVIGLNRLRRRSRLAARNLAAVSAAWAANGFGLSTVSEQGKQA
jgi:adenosylhomocysteine nucleosidase